MAGPPEPAADAADPAPQQAWSPAEAEAAAALWFELEDPLERDALIDRLAAAQWPHSEVFFAAVLADDPDPAIAHTAAVALVRRHHPAGIAWLEGCLGGDDEKSVGAAAQRLAAELGPTCYPRLHQIWRDVGRDRGVRRAALAALAVADPPRARADIVECLAAACGPAAAPLDEGELEVALWILAEGEAAAALPVLGRLAAHLAGAGDEARGALALVAAAAGILAAPGDT